MAYKTLQNPWAEGLGNDYEQDMKYVVEYAKKDENGKLIPAEKGEAGAKSTWRDGIYTKLALDIKDPEGYNKRTVNIPQSAWGKDFDTIPTSGFETMSGETDGSALFTSGYGRAVSFGFPFGETPETYYTDKVDDGLPTGIDVASFRQVVPSGGDKAEA